MIDLIIGFISGCILTEVLNLFFLERLRKKLESINESIYNSELHKIDCLRRGICYNCRKPLDSNRLLKDVGKGKNEN